MLKPLLFVFLIILIILFIGWLGLQVKPKPFEQPLLSNSKEKARTISLPAGLPAPVERFYRQMYGDQIPVIDSVVITGRGIIRPFGIWMPTRFIITHETGRNYRHYFEVTFFGAPFLLVQEGILDGKSFFESPMGSDYNDPNTNQGANLALWAEGGWFPAIWVTDPRVRWQAVDDNTAILFVPYEDGEENFVVRFNPQTGLVDRMEAMRFKGKGDADKVLWITNEVVVQGQPSVSYATWLDDGQPWAAFTLEEIEYNLNVSQYIRARGK
jgi:hypothetical protein